MHARILIISITLVQSPIIEMEGGCLKQLVYAFMLLLLPLSLSLEFNNSDGITRCIERERQVLLAFKQGFTTGHGDSKVLSSWGGRDCCRLQGVYCYNQTGHVTRLHSGDQLLTGEISPKLIVLQHLEYLDLGFHGSQIPNFIGSLTNLRYLDLYLPQFDGKFPYQLGNLTHLQYITVIGNYNTRVRANNLNWLPYLSSLRYLDISWKFTSIPCESAWFRRQGIICFI